jgi:predicted DNA-binding protein (MmcQ/YjbR family)
MKVRTTTALKKMREICAALPGTGEGSHFDSIAFKAGGRMFASYRDTGDDSEIVVQLEPDHADALVDSDDRFARYPRARNCIVFRSSAVKSWVQIRELVHESYRLNAPEKVKAKPVRKPKK